jgi:hypothetical protein
LQELKEAVEEEEEEEDEEEEEECPVRPIARSVERKSIWKRE